MNSRCQMKPSRPVSSAPDIAMSANAGAPSAAAIAQAARSDRDGRRFVRRLRQRGRRGIGADRIGVGRQWLDPGALVVLRHLWPEADLWSAVARAIFSFCREF